MEEIFIDENKKYQIPEDISIVSHKGQFLIVAPNKGNWIVLENQLQLDIIKSFKNNFSIQEVKKDFLEEDVIKVVTQLEAKQFCSNYKTKITDGEFKLHLYITNACNLKCPHCYMYSGKAKEDELSSEEIKDLLTEYKNLNKGLSITISGGEPSVRKDFLDILKFAKELGLKINLLTNGIYKDIGLIKEMVKYIDSVQISIDGFSEISNSKIRGENNFQKALDAAKAFTEYEIETTVAITPPMENLEAHIDDYYKFATQLIRLRGTNNIRVKFAEGITKGREINPTDSDNIQYECMIKEIERRVYGINPELISFIETLEQNTLLDNCMYGNLTIESNGNTYLCPELPSNKNIFNIRTHKLKEIYKFYIKAAKNTCVDKITPCKTCELKYICGAGCRVKFFPELHDYPAFEKECKNLVRHCSSKIKKKFYDLMLDANEYLFILA